MLCWPKGHHLADMDQLKLAATAMTIGGKVHCAGVCRVKTQVWGAGAVSSFRQYQAGCTAEHVPEAGQYFHLPNPHTKSAPYQHSHKLTNIPRHVYNQVGNASTSKHFCHGWCARKGWGGQWGKKAAVKGSSCTAGVMRVWVW